MNQWSVKDIYRATCGKRIKGA